MTARSGPEMSVKQFISGLVRRNPAETEFHQAVREFVETVMRSNATGSRTMTSGFGRPPPRSRRRRIDPRQHDAAMMCGSWLPLPHGAH